MGSAPPAPRTPPAHPPAPRAHGSVHPQAGGTHTQAKEAFPKRSPAGLEAVWCSEKEQKTARSRLPSGEKPGGGPGVTPGPWKCPQLWDQGPTPGDTREAAGAPAAPLAGRCCPPVAVRLETRRGREWRKGETGGELS